MSATETSIQETFNDYFGETSTHVDFEFIDAATDRNFRFTREEETEEYQRCNIRIPGFLPFNEAIHKYSKWGNSAVTFTLYINDVQVCKYRYSPEDVILPNLLSNLTPEEKRVLNGGIYVAKTKSKTIIREIDTHMSRLVRSEFRSYI